jgi:hypothetical protein
MFEILFYVSLMSEGFSRACRSCSKGQQGADCCLSIRGRINRQNSKQISI